jgi:hypothetical protein
MKALRTALKFAAIWMCLHATSFAESTDTEITAATVDKIPFRLTTTTAASQGSLRYLFSIEMKSNAFANVKPAVSLSIEKEGKLVASIPVSIFQDGSKWGFSFFISPDLLEGTRVDIDFPSKYKNGQPAPSFDGFWFKLNSPFLRAHK